MDGGGGGGGRRGYEDRGYMRNKEQRRQYQDNREEFVEATPGELLF